MKHEYINAIKNGTVVKAQTFETDKGTYGITLIRYHNHIYFVKNRNGTILECCNLNKITVKKE